MNVDDHRPPDPSLQPSTYYDIRAFDSEINLKIAKTRLLLLRVCAAAMTTTLIHRSPIHRKWVKAMELVDAEHHGKILHLGSQIYPRSGCFKKAVRTNLKKAVRTNPNPSYRPTIILANYRIGEN
jgi:hypothetical protein